jgi:hypothetical protein
MQEISMMTSYSAATDQMAQLQRKRFTEQRGSG